MTPTAWICITIAVIFVASLIVGSILGRPPKKDSRRSAMFAEKRRILERDRAWWLGAVGNGDRKDQVGATKEVLKIDERLLQLADQEAEEIAEEDEKST